MKVKEGLKNSGYPREFIVKYGIYRDKMPKKLQQKRNRFSFNLNSKVTILK